MVKARELIDLGQIELGVLLDRGGHARIGNDGLEVGLSDSIGTDMKIQLAKLELNARQIRVQEQHPLQRTDRRLVVPQPGRNGSKAEHEVEICWTLQHLREKLVILRLQLGALLLR